MIELPSGFVTGIGTNATSFLAEMSPLLQLVLGILLTTGVIVTLIQVISHRN